MSKSAQKQGDILFSKAEKISTELLALTYGTFVSYLLKESENAEEVNIQLEKIGYNIGTRIIDEFFAKSQFGLCSDLRETAEVLGKGAFKMFLGVPAEVTKWSEDGKEFSLILSDNPLADFVMIPVSHQSLWYSNIICGVVRGALEMLNFKVSCFFQKDVLRGNDATEIRVVIHEILQDKYEDDEL